MPLSFVNIFWAGEVAAVFPILPGINPLTIRVVALVARFKLFPLLFKADYGPT